MYSGYGIAFDIVFSWWYSRNVITFDVDNSSSSHAENLTHNFWILGEGPALGISGSFGSTKKTFSVNNSKASTKFCLSLHYNVDNSYLFVDKKFKLNL